MPSTPPTISVGDPVLASDLDALFLAADERLERLYSGSRSWFVFDTSSVPAQQIPAYGAVYVLSADADRDLLPAPGSAGCPHGGLWPAQYNHASHVAAAAAMTLVGPDSTIAWEVSGGFSVDVYSFGDSASVLERNVAGDTRPLRRSGDYEPERFHRYAVADIFIESAATTGFSWLFDKYGVVRFHNLSTFSVDVDLGSSTISIEPRRVRTVRRTSRTGAWDTTTRRYFPKVLPGDIPMWDSDVSSMANLPLRSQAANPLFRQAMVQSMFRPQVLTTGPGMFSSSIVPVLPAVDDASAISAAIVQNGAFEVVRTATGSQTRHTLLYSGEGLSTTPAAWAAVGLSVSLSTPDRGALVVVGDPTYSYDIFSKSTNVSGGVISPVPTVFLPWFKDAAAADAWYSALFIWPDYAVTRTAVQGFWEDGAVWTPAGGGADVDYYGSWSTGTFTEARQYDITWGTSTYASVPAWNVFSTSIASALPSGTSLVRQPILTATVGTSTASFWADREDATWDDEGPITPRPAGNDRGLYAGAELWGLGAPDEDGGWIEPRWQLALFPTIGHDELTTWDGFGFYGTEPIIWTPLLPDGSGGTFSHWRVVGAGGLASGASWSWDFDGSAFVPSGIGPTGEVDSGMSFWRMFAQYQVQPGGGTRYPGKAKTGPQPWMIRDHGWLAKGVLDSGASWSAARAGLYDGASISPLEAGTGMQIRMTASSFNQMSALIAGMSHVRPCGWEQYVDGFSFDSLVTASGWFLGYSDLYAQPAGAVHIYGLDFTTDGKLDAAGVVRRSATNADLQAFQALSLQEYYPVLTFLGETLYFDVRTSASAAPWASNIGNSKQYCTADDIHDALSVQGFSYNLARLVQPIEVSPYVPGGDESEVDVYDASTAGGLLLVEPIFRVRSETTKLIPTPVETSEIQMAPVVEDFYEIQSERPMQASLVTRNGGYPALSLRTTGPTTGAFADSLHRLQSAQGPLWSATVLARSGLSVRVLCLPLRHLVTETQGLDDTGPRARLPFVAGHNSPFVLPNATVRPVWRTVSAGGSISTEDLAGASPTYPEQSHVWRLLPLDPTVEVM